MTVDDVNVTVDNVDVMVDDVDAMVDGVDVAVRVGRRDDNHVKLSSLVPMKWSSKVASLVPRLPRFAHSRKKLGSRGRG